jgi:hypothetical protein
MHVLRKLLKQRLRKKRRTRLSIIKPAVSIDTAVLLCVRSSTVAPAFATSLSVVRTEIIIMPSGNSRQNKVSTPHPRKSVVVLTTQPTDKTFHCYFLQTKTDQFHSVLFYSESQKAGALRRLFGVPPPYTANKIAKYTPICILKYIFKYTFYAYSTYQSQQNRFPH